MALPMTPASRWIQELDYELYEEDDEFVLTLDMPGIERDEISVGWDDGVLNIAAEHTDSVRSSRVCESRSCLAAAGS